MFFVFFGACAGLVHVVCCFVFFGASQNIDRQQKQSRNKAKISSNLLSLLLHLLLISAWRMSIELCPKGPVLLKAIRICLRVRLRLAYATTVLAYARDFVEFALTRSLRLQVFAPHHSASLRAAIFTSRMPWSWNLRQASDAVEVDEDEEVQKEGRISHRRTMSLQKVRHCLHNFPLAARHYFREASFFGRHCGLRKGMWAYADLTRGLRGAYADFRGQPLSNFNL